MPRHLTYETILDSVSDFSGVIDPNFETVTIKDPLRGGVFDKYTGSQSVDDGVIFQDSLGNKWKRRITEGHINVKWYPVVENTPMDAIFAQIMLAATNTENISYPKIFFPKNTSGATFYQFASTVIIDNIITIFGEGEESKLRWNQNVPGIVTNYVTSRRTSIHDIRIGTSSASSPSGSPLGSNWNVAQYGIEARDIIYLNNVTFAYWAGLGALYMYGDATHPTNPTNVNNSIISYCTFAQNRVHGLYLQGPDANAVEVIKIDSVANGGAGVRDKSFLGNHYLHGHSASNGSPEISWQRGLVKVGTDVYACITDGTVGIEPGVTVGWENNWVLTGEAWSGFPSVGTYDATRIYYVVCGYSIQGANQYGTFIGNYAESDQYASFISPGNFVSNYNLILRTGSASNLRGHASGLWNQNSFFAGNPGDTAAYKSFIQRDLGLGQGYSSTSGFKFWYNETRKCMELTSLVGTRDTSNFRWFNFDATAANQGRVIAKPSLAAFSGILLNSVNSRSNWNLLDAAYSVPPTATYDIGDSFICYGKTYLHFRPEDIIVKYSNPVDGAATINANAKMLIIKGHFESAFTNASAGNLNICADYNIATDKIVVYNVLFVSEVGADSCVLERRITVKNTSGTLSVLQDLVIGTDIASGVFATTDVNAFINTDDITLRVENMPATADGKIHVKRLAL